MGISIRILFSAILIFWACEKPLPTSIIDEIRSQTEDGLFEDALSVIGEHESEVDSEWAAYHRGWIQSMNDDPAEAARLFQRATTSLYLPLRYRALYNLGNANYRLGEKHQRSGDMKKAVEHYRLAMTSYKDLINALGDDGKKTQLARDAQYNRELAKLRFKFILDAINQQNEQNSEQNKHIQELVETLSVAIMQQKSIIIGVSEQLGSDVDGLEDLPLPQDVVIPDPPSTPQIAAEHQHLTNTTILEASAKLNGIVSGLEESFKGYEAQVIKANGGAPLSDDQRAEAEKPFREQMARFEKSGSSLDEGARNSSQTIEAFEKLKVSDGKDRAQETHSSLFNALKALVENNDSSSSPQQSQEDSSSQQPQDGDDASSDASDDASKNNQPENEANSSQGEKSPSEDSAEGSKDENSENDGASPSPELSAEEAEAQLKEYFQNTQDQKESVEKEMSQSPGAKNRVWRDW